MEAGERDDSPKKEKLSIHPERLILPGNPRKMKRNCRKIPVLLSLIGKYEKKKKIDNIKWRERRGRAAVLSGRSNRGLELIDDATLT